MNENSYAAICAQVNSSFEIRQFIQYVGHFPEKLKRDGDLYLALCPIHGETVFRTLILNPRNNTYHCSHFACPGHQPADFLDLLVRVRNSTLPEVLDDVIEHFGPAYFRITPAQREVVKDLVRQVRGG